MSAKVQFLHDGHDESVDEQPNPKCSQQGLTWEGIELIQVEEEEPFRQPAKPGIGEVNIQRGGSA